MVFSKLYCLCKQTSVVDNDKGWPGTSIVKLVKYIYHLINGVWTETGDSTVVIPMYSSFVRIVMISFLQKVRYNRIQKHQHMFS